MWLIFDGKKEETFEQDEFYENEDGDIDFMNNQTFNDDVMKVWDEDWHTKNANFVKITSSDDISLQAEFGDLKVDVNCSKLQHNDFNIKIEPNILKFTPDEFFKQDFRIPNTEDENKIDMHFDDFFKNLENPSYISSYKPQNSKSKSDKALNHQNQNVSQLLPNRFPSNQPKPPQGLPPKFDKNNRFTSNQPKPPQGLPPKFDKNNRFSSNQPKPPQGLPSKFNNNFSHSNNNLKFPSYPKKVNHNLPETLTPLPRFMKLIKDKSAADLEKNDPYAGLMSKKEKWLILKIQLRQLQCEDPYLEDYYYTVCMMKHILVKDPDVAFPYPKQIEIPTNHLFTPNTPHLPKNFFDIPDLQDGKLIFDISPFIVPSNEIEIFYKKPEERNIDEKKITEEVKTIKLSPPPLPSTPKQLSAASPYKFTRSNHSNSQSIDKLNLDYSSITYLLDKKLNEISHLTTTTATTTLKDEKIDIVTENNEDISNEKSESPSYHNFGKMPRSNMKQPHVLLEISFSNKRNHNTCADADSQNSITNYRQLLLFIEQLYKLLLSFDDPQHKIIAESQGIKCISLSSEMKDNRDVIFNQIFPLFHCENNFLDKFKDITTCPDDSLEDGPIKIEAIRFMQILCINKGRTLISRFIPYLEPEPFKYLILQLCTYIKYFVRWDFDDQVSAKLINSLSRYICKNVIQLNKDDFLIENLLKTLSRCLYYSGPLLQNSTNEEEEYKSLIKESLSNKFIFAFQLVVLLPIFAEYDTAPSNITLKEIISTFLPCLLEVYKERCRRNLNLTKADDLENKADGTSSIYLTYFESNVCQFKQNILKFQKYCLTTAEITNILAEKDRLYLLPCFEFYFGHLSIC